MQISLPQADRLPCTADHYQWKGKPVALLPGRFGVVYEPAPRKVPWSEIIRSGTRISARQFELLMYDVS